MEHQLLRIRHPNSEDILKGSVFVVHKYFKKQFDKKSRPNTNDECKKVTNSDNWTCGLLADNLIMCYFVFDLCTSLGFAFIK